MGLSLVGIYIHYNISLLNHKFNISAKNQQSNISSYPILKQKNFNSVQASKLQTIRKKAIINNFEHGNTEKEKSNSIAINPVLKKNKLIPISYFPANFRRKAFRNL